MEKQTLSKIRMVCFLLASFIAYVAVEVVMRSLAGAFSIVQRFNSNDLVNHGLPIVSAVVLFGVLQFNPKVLTWADEVILEVSKVVWPSRKDTTAMAIVVCVMVFIASIILSVFDLIAREAVHLIIN